MDELGTGSWEEAFGHFFNTFEKRFKRSESRQTAQNYVRGLLSEVKRKNCWQLAEKVGESDPQAMQRLLYDGKWDSQAVCQDMRKLIIDQMGYEPGVGVIDESGFVKKGEKSAGVHRQYCGHVGKVENCQVGVFLGYVSPQGHALLDRALYLPQAWTDDGERCATAKIPEAMPFRTKPQLAQAMLEQAWDEGIPLNWVTGDTIYGNSRLLREAIDDRQRHYVLQVAKSCPLVATDEAIPHPAEYWLTFDKDWQQLAFGWGEKGLIVNEWKAWRVVSTTDNLGEQWLLIRRTLSPTPDVTYYLSNASADTPIETLAQVACARHQIEQLLEEARGNTGLADYEVRYWHSWYAHITLALLAHAFITLLRHANTQKKSIATPGLAVDQFC